MQSYVEILEFPDTANAFEFSGFESLVAPKGRDEFFDHYWERQPLFVKRDRPGYFDDLLRLEDMDDYLGTRAFHRSDLRLVKQGKDLSFDDYSKDGVADRAKLMQMFNGGAMMLFSHLNRFHSPLAEMLSACEAEIHVPMRSNVYLSPPGSRGFDLHWDTHDVIVLQISGTKRWHLYDSPVELPHEQHQQDKKRILERASKLTEVVMTPGSMLFLPRGFVHGAEAENDHSLHITIGLRSMTIADVIVGEFRRKSLLDLDMRKVVLFDECDEPARMEEARAALRRVVESMDIGAALDDLYKSFIQSRQPPARGALLDALSVAEVDHATPLRLRSGVLYQVFRESDGISLAVDGTALNLPVGIEDAIERIATGDVFVPEELPGLEYESRLILSRKMLGARFVERV